jgi:2-methylfumaryl-CoA isomerase
VSPFSTSRHTASLPAVASPKPAHGQQGFSSQANENTCGPKFFPCYERLNTSQASRVTILSGLRITECAAFIAGPFATMSLASLGAEVIRIDPLEGGLDYHRWPVTDTGRSLYWAGLNKGKKSVSIDLRSPEGRELAQAIITAPGEDSGLFITNFPATGWLDFEKLKALRGDLIMANILGNRDGSTALDYTVNCAIGFPSVTGAPGDSTPTNHVLPAWDLLCGMTAATGLLAAERHRRKHGVGQLLKIALSDIALAVVADLGFIAEVQVNGDDRARHGNHIFGAFGHDFETKDRRRIMVAAVSLGQWKTLCKATGIGDAVKKMEQSENLDMSREGDRFAARESLARLLAPWFAARTVAEAASSLDAEKACWGLYQSFSQLVNEDPRCSTASSLFAQVDHPGIGTTLTPRSPIDFAACEPVPPGAGPILGQHTDEVLADVLRLSNGQIAALHDNGIVAGQTA